MRSWTRRDVLRSGLAAAGAAALPAVPADAHALDIAPGAAPADDPARDPHAPLAPEAGVGRERLLLDVGWRFHLGTAADPTRGFNAPADPGYAKAGRLFAPSSPTFDDSAWQAVDLPHDWAPDLPFVDDPRLVDWGFKPIHREYPESSVGWYRRTFALPAADTGRRLSLEFDGVFRDAIVVLNGHLVGRNLGGYVPFRFDVTDVANAGGQNVLVVHVDASEHEGWFYEGAGVSRHVWLVKTAPVHVPQWGTYVTAEPAADGSSAAVTVRTELVNEGDAPAECRLVSTVLDPAGRAVARADAVGVRLAPFERVERAQAVRLATPALWSPESPSLYRLVTTVEVGGATVDRYETLFGVRSLRFDAAQGFFLNGRRTELRGTCNHQDHAGVGAALPDRLHAFRVERLKALGSNAYRASHNPPAPELLDACDRLGMLVIDETRLFASSDEGLGQLERMIRRDRNRPSVIAWSIANEEPEQGTPKGRRIAESMRRLVKRLDPTRPVTAAMDQGWGSGITPALDVIGFNYRAPQTDAFHASHPALPIIGSEQGSTVQTRGVYANDTAKGYVSAYDVNAPWWASTAEAWYTRFAARPWLGGGFIWTGFDYRGEPTPYQWPCISSHFGVLDTCGHRKDLSYYYEAAWTERPVLHLFPHWNWGTEGQPVEVWAFTNLDRVELFLNGRSLGARDVPRHTHAAWTVPYAPGAIEARGYRRGQAAAVLVERRETTGPGVRVVLEADRPALAADGEDAAIITARVVDARGRAVPTASNQLEFRVSGNGRLLGVGNGDPSSHESDRGPRRRLFNGLASAIVQAAGAPGALRVEAVAAGLAPGRVEVACRPAAARPRA